MIEANLYRCPSCGGDGKETCHNPDHGFLSGVINAIKSANESACPCCGHDSEHKVKKWNSELKKFEYKPCWYCDGTGECKATKAALALAECNIDEPLEDFLLNPIS